jgi:murein DD-endopeptidase MepM/ murein hydrolase activator NlpD
MKKKIYYLMSGICCLLVSACDLHDKIVGENYSRPEQIESRAYEYGFDTNADEYIQYESRADYNDDKVGQVSPKLAYQRQPSEKVALPTPPPSTPSPQPSPKATADFVAAITAAEPPIARGGTEPDDILLVPARVAAVPAKVEIIAPAASEIIVAKGDTLYSLARAHGVPLRDLVDENKISAPYAISVGQKLKVPGARVHIVASGETLYSISRKYSVDLNSLATENKITAPYALAVGQKLRLPAVVGREGSLVSSQQSVVSTQQELANLNAQQKQMDAEKKKLDAEKSRLESEKAKAAAAQKKSDVEKKQKEIVATEKKSAELETKRKRMAAQIEEKKKISSAPAKPLPKVAAAKLSFTWPVRGKILSSFGYKKNGLYNDGINIGAATGTAVKAAESGVVAYAGNELKGMGNLIIVQHANGWMSVYSHLDSMSVRRGARVAKGGKIGVVGKTGKVSEPQLHFEIRKGTKAYDPQKELK